MDASMEQAGNQAFGKLFGYISGNNRSQAKIAMTAPVGQVQEGSRWVVSFVMPASYTLETLPVPADDAITLRLVPTRRMAALRYAGRWTERGFIQHRTALETWLNQRNLRVVGEPVWARYNSPFPCDFCGGTKC